MGKLLEQLKSYFENTPANILEKESAEWDYLNEIGPDVLEYANIVKGYISAKIAYRSSHDLINKSYYNFVVSIEVIGANAQYGKAA
jgi:tyrosine type site-specific recombinase